MLESVFIILVALALDWCLGDPLWIPHPIILFGKCISFLEKKHNKGKHRQLAGTITTSLLIITTALAFYLIMNLFYLFNTYVGMVVEVILLFLGLAGTTLIKEGKDVFKALNVSLEAGQQQVGRIVGRDTSQLTAHEVRKATLETLAENLSDGVIAPLFWYAIAGIPGIMTYKMINTLDSMIGYKSDRYLHYGRIAAYIDDIANWLPARITAFIMCVVGFKSRAWSFVKRYGRAHSSPNSGYPESALAGILDLRFGGPSNYFGKIVDKPYIGTNGRSITDRDMSKTIIINRATETIMVLLIITINICLFN